MNFFNKINQMDLRKYAPVVLRLLMVFVFIWFGVNQLINQSAWLSLIPDWVISLSHLSAGTIVTLNGVFEIITAILLAIGFQIRVVAFLLFLHLGTIVMDLGLNAIGVRDVGLMAAMLSIALHGADAYSFDKVSLSILR